MRRTEYSSLASNQSAPCQSGYRRIVRIVKAGKDGGLGRNLCAAVCVVFLCAPCVDAEKEPPASSDPPSEKQIQFFETKIRPLLADHCYECHGEESQESDLRVDTLLGMLKGGLAGPSVSPGKADSSLLMTAVRYQDSDLRMPPEEKLSDAQIADLANWIEMGAPHPDSSTTQPVQRGSDVDLEKGRQHWAFQPPVKHTPPKIDPNAPEENPIDAFLLAGLQDQGLQRVPLADKETFIRRATFDLLGLPPTQEEITAFVEDDSPAAVRRLVDRLLASPHYGERWGRHWLDVARYADSNGVDENIAHGNAWRYRDYVIAAFNNDKPYDQFVTEQLAGDLLESGEETSLRNERLVATGFLVLGPKFLAEQDQTKMAMDIIDEQLDTVGRSLLGLTFGCARCHTHKFDPISHHDYYGLAGIFKSTHTMDSYKTIAKWHENEIPTSAEAEHIEAHQKKVAAQEKKIADRLAEAFAQLPEVTEEKPEAKKKTAAEKEKLLPAEVQGELKTLRDALKVLQDNKPEMPSAMGVTDGTIVDTPVHLRGSHLTLGDVVPRRFPQVLTSVDQPPLPAEKSGRLEFARWLTNGEHPLTARVMVNRIWHGHFGKGLVGTVDNFGLQGDRPSHPELLDWLAIRFVEEGWSLKSMHRLIMTSDAYQASSQFNAENHQKDPGNRYYWRFDLRRLEAEAIRDSLLAVSGKLNRTAGGSMLTVKNREFLFNHTSQDKSTYVTFRRSIYIPVIRNHLYDMFKLFDYSNASILNGNRNVSTIAPQALFMMNSEWMDDVTFSLADRLLAASPDSKQRIEQLYLDAYGRQPSDNETAMALKFVTQMNDNLESQSEEEAERHAWQALCQSVVSANEFVYIR